MRSLEILLEIGGLRKTEDHQLQLPEKKTRWYVEYILQMDQSEILPGVLTFLQELKESGVKNALGSDSNNARTFLERL